MPVQRARLWTLAKVGHPATPQSAGTRQRPLAHMRKSPTVGKNCNPAFGQLGLQLGPCARRPLVTFHLTRGQEGCEVRCGQRRCTDASWSARRGILGRCAMRLASSAGLSLCVVLAAASVARAKCDPTTDPDKTDIANARAAGAANCDCAGATSHGDYVSCAAQQANLTLVNKNCAGAVKRCAVHSTCGKPGAVTCCVTRTNGTRCKVKRDAMHCTGPQGASACVDSYTSCCDACASGGCPTTTTVTTSTTSTTCPAAHCGDGIYQPGCGEECDGTAGVCNTTGHCGAPTDRASCRCCVPRGGTGIWYLGYTPPCCDGSGCQIVSPRACACNFCWPSGSPCIATAYCCSGDPCPSSGACP